MKDLKKLYILPIVLLMLLLSSTKIKEKDEGVIYGPRQEIKNEFLKEYKSSVVYALTKIEDSSKGLLCLDALLIANQEKIPRGIALSLIITENPKIDPSAKGPKNTDGSRDLGFCQLNSYYLDEFVDRFWIEEEEFNVYNHRHNSIVAFRLLKSLYNKYGNWYLALKAYNGGPGRVYTNVSKSYAEKILNLSKTKFEESYY